MAELFPLVVPAKILTDGTHKIRIAVSHKHDTRYIITRFKIDNLKQFKNGRVVGRPDASIINQKLNALLNRYYDILDSINPNAFTCPQLKDYLENYNCAQSVKTVSQCWQSYIDNLNNEDRTGTANLHARSKIYFEEKYGANVLLLSVSANTVTHQSRLSLNRISFNTASQIAMVRIVSSV